MIAPIHMPDPWAPEKVRVLRKARRIVAAMLFGPPTPTTAEPPPLAAWKGWLFAAWVVGVTAVYVWAMLRK